MLQLNPKANLGPSRTGTGHLSQTQSRLLFALIVLMIALAIVLVGDHGIWSSSDENDVDLSQPQVEQQTAVKAPTSAASEAPAAAAPVKKQAVAAKRAVEPKPAQPASSGVVVNRTTVPPLNVEIVAGNKHRTLHPGSNATKVEIASANSVATQPNAIPAPTTEAAERERISTTAAVVPPPSYPPLTQHMNVQGSVVLQALISAEGLVENLRVLSGPAILAAAAQQAVREWRFKPVFENGQAVETKAKITVNFIIKVADGTENPTLAESRPDDILILTR